MIFPTEEQIEFLANAISTKTVDEDFFNQLASEIVSAGKYKMTENDFEHFRWGFTYGFTYAIEGIHNLISNKRSV